MIAIDLQAIPNQNFTIQLENKNYDITIKTIDANNKMCITILRDNVAIISGFELISNMPIIPYRHLEHGNFIISTNDDNMPDYTQFNVTQFFYYVTVAELVAARV